MLKFLLFASLSLITIVTNAQQYPVVGQFYYFQLYFNPAYAGANEKLNFATLHRSQWSGLSRSPSTTIISGDGQIGSNIGLGFTASNDRFVALNQTDVFGNVSYRLKTGDESHLQFGLRVGGSFVKTGFDELTHWDDDDIVINESVRTAFIPRIGSGIYYYNTRFYAGLSVPDLLSFDTQKLFYNQTTQSKTFYRNYFITGGANFRLNYYTTFLPNLLITYYPTRSPFVNLNLGLEFNKTITVGVGYSTPSAMALYGMLAASKKIKIGYRFEYSPTKFQLGKYGSHEIMLAWGLNQ